MNRLLKIGFEYVGHWSLDESNELSLTLESNHNSKNILYSYISNGNVMYVGKTTQSLQKRLYGYQNPGQTQSTNIRVSSLITEQLENNVPVDIFILNDDGLLKFGDFTINIAAGLEDSLISEISPVWNSVGKNKNERLTKKAIIQKHRIDTREDIDAEQKSFDIKLGQTYYQQGFFNVPISFSNYFAEDGSNIEMVLGSEKKQIYGHINRRANKNNTPRIMGGIDLREWTQDNFNLNEILRIKIVSPVSIEII